MKKGYLILFALFLFINLYSQTGYTVNTVNNFSDFTCGSGCTNYVGSGLICYPNNSVMSQTKISRSFWISCPGTYADSVVWSYKYKSNGGTATSIQIQLDILNGIVSNTVVSFNSVDSGIVKGSWINYPLLVPMVFNPIVNNLGSTSNNFCIQLKDLLIKAYCAGTTTIIEQKNLSNPKIWSNQNSIYFDPGIKSEDIIIYNSLGQIISNKIVNEGSITLNNYKGVVFVKLNREYYKLLVMPD